MIDEAELVNLICLDRNDYVIGWVSVLRTQPDLIASYQRRGYMLCDLATLEAAQQAMWAGRTFSEQRARGTKRDRPRLSRQHRRDPVALHAARML